MKRPTISHEDIGNDLYNCIQVKITMYGRGGLVILVKKVMQMITAEVVGEEEGDNFF